MPTLVSVWETDWTSSDEHFVFLNASSAIADPVLQLTPTMTNNVYWLLWRFPYIDPVTDPVKVAVKLTWYDF